MMYTRYSEVKLCDGIHYYVSTFYSLLISFGLMFLYTFFICNLGSSMILPLNLCAITSKPFISIHNALFILTFLVHQRM
jgi:hypothetical protein